MYRVYFASIAFLASCAGKQYCGCTAKSCL